MNLKLNSLAFTVIFLNAGVIHAAPGAGSDYIKDRTNWYTHTAVGEAFDSVNHILCMVKQTAYDSISVLNQGYYLALVDETSCDTSGSPNGAGPSNPNNGVQDGSAIEYSKWKVNSEIVSGTTTQTVKAFVDTVERKKYQAKTIITGAVSDKNDLGIFDLNYKEVTPKDKSTPAVTRKGIITSSVSNNLLYLKHAEKGISIEDGKANNIDVKVVIQKEGTSGSGSISASSTMGGKAETKKANFAYNPSNYFVADAENSIYAQCFDRTKTENSAWRYGLYNADDGSRAQVKSGFPINTKPDGSGTNGYIGYWGLWMSNGVILKSGDKVYKQRRPGESDTDPYTLSIKKGVLKKLIRHTAKLSEIKNIPMMGTIDASQDQVVDRIIWNGANLVIDATTEGWGNLDWIPESPPTPIGPNFSVNQTTLNLWSEALDGNVSIELKSCKEAGTLAGGFNCDAPTGDTSIVYYTQQRIGLSESVPVLICYNDCPKIVGDELSDEPINIDTLVENPIAAPTYTFKNGLLVDSRGVNIIPTNKYEGEGAHSGPLFADIKANKDRLKCLFDNSKICPWQAWSKLDVFYTWSTSNNEWDNVVRLTDSSGNVVQFDPPIDLSFTYPSDGTSGYNSNITDTKFKGSTFKLQYSSFGDLGNIPGKCVDPNKPGAKVDDCSQEGLRWVPEFTIPPGTTVKSTLTNSSTKSYLLKPLEIEQRFAITDLKNCSGLTGKATDKSGQFLDIKKNWKDPALGNEPPLPPLRVIAGEVQP